MMSRIIAPVKLALYAFGLSFLKLNARMNPMIGKNRPTKNHPTAVPSCGGTE
jgi:hypothetical protein